MDKENERLNPKSQKKPPEDQNDITLVDPQSALNDVTQFDRQVISQENQEPSQDSPLEKTAKRPVLRKFATRNLERITPEINKKPLEETRDIDFAPQELLAKTEDMSQSQVVNNDDWPLHKENPFGETKPLPVVAPKQKSPMEGGNAYDTTKAMHSPQNISSGADIHLDKTQDIPPNVDAMHLEKTQDLDSFFHSAEKIQEDQMTGQIINGKYKVLGLLGQGGMGVVYKVEHLLLTHKKYFALKLLHKDLLKAENFRKRFIREVEIAMEFVHEHAVQIRDFGITENDELYFTMDYSQGKLLRTLIAESLLDTSHALKIAKQILLALQSAHAKSIVHRDLKPENILVENRQGQLHSMVLDFGIAKALENQQTEQLTQGIIGTPFYMAPEQIEGNNIDHRADLYALGVMLYQMVTGQLPFTGKSREVLLGHLQTTPVSPHIIKENIPPKVGQLILKALEKDPQKRYSSAQEFIEAIDQCQTITTTLNTEYTGKIINARYRVIKKLGEGGMGVVYQVEHLLLQNKLFALKLLHKHLISPEFQKRFVREVEAAMEFVHENSVQIREFGETEDGSLFFTMDYCSGISLRDVIRQKKSLPIPEALHIVRQVLLALKNAHDKGIIHRDIKPDNIMIDTINSKVHAFVLDFGIAKPLRSKDEDLTQEQILGTPLYMSPEQAGAEELDQRTDLYSLSVVLYEMITGRPPFSGNPKEVWMSHMLKSPPAPTEIKKNIPSIVEDLLLKGLAKEKQQRFHDAEDFISAIDELKRCLEEKTTTKLPNKAQVHQRIAQMSTDSRVFTPEADTNIGIKYPAATTSHSIKVKTISPGEKMRRKRRRRIFMSTFVMIFAMVTLGFPNLVHLLLENLSVHEQTYQHMTKVNTQLDNFWISLQPVEDDMFEPNPNRNRARLIAPGIYKQLQILENDEDWYAIDMPAQHYLNAIVKAKSKDLIVEMIGKDQTITNSENKLRRSFRYLNPESRICLIGIKGSKKTTSYSIEVFIEPLQKITQPQLTFIPQNSTAKLADKVFSHETNELLVEVTFHNKWLQRPHSHRFEWKFFGPQWEDIAQQNIEIAPDEEVVVRTIEFQKKASNWDAGKYQVELWCDNAKLTESSFTIEYVLSPHEKATFEKLQQLIVTGQQNYQIFRKNLKREDLVALNNTVTEIYKTLEGSNSKYPEMESMQKSFETLQKASQKVTTLFEDKINKQISTIKKLITQSEGYLEKFLLQNNQSYLQKSQKLKDKAYSLIKKTRSQDKENPQLARFEKRILNLHIKMSDAKDIVRHKNQLEELRESQLQNNFEDAQELANEAMEYCKLTVETGKDYLSKVDVLRAEFYEFLEKIRRAGNSDYQNKLQNLLSKIDAEKAKAKQALTEIEQNRELADRNKQVWHKDSQGIPLEKIKEGWKRGYSLTSLTHGNNTWGMIMTQDRKQQKAYVHKSFPLEQIQQSWKQGYIVSSIAFGKNDYVVIMTKGKQQQQIFQGNQIPEEKIQREWRRGYTITCLAYGPKQWFVVMTLNNTNGYIVTSLADISNTTFLKMHEQRQKYFVDNSFPGNRINQYIKQGYNATQLAFGNTWGLVVTRGIKQQTWHRDIYFPKDTIEERWQRGYIVSCLTFAKDKWIVLFTKVQ